MNISRKFIPILTALMLVLYCAVQPSSVQAQLPVLMQNAAVANGNGNLLNTTGQATAVITVNCVSCSGGTRVNFEGQDQAGNTTALEATLLADGSQATNTTASGVTMWAVSVSGLAGIQTRISLYSAGTVTVRGVAVPQPSGSAASSSGGGGGAITAALGAIADGADVTLGAKADAKSTATDSTAITVMQVLKEISAQIQILGAAITSSKMATTVANGDNTAIGSTTDTASTVVNGSAATMIAILKELSVQLQALGASVTPINSRCNILTTASTNSTSCKGSPGNRTGLFVVNTTATLYYLRLYNTASAPTCSSATGFVISIPIPASATGNGLAIPMPNGGVAFDTGLGYCFTGGSTSTDNTNAAAGLFGEMYYN